MKSKPSFATVAPASFYCPHQPRVRLSFVTLFILNTQHVFSFSRFVVSNNVIEYMYINLFITTTKTSHCILLFCLLTRYTFGQLFVSFLFDHELRNVCVTRAQRMQLPFQKVSVERSSYNMAKMLGSHQELWRIYLLKNHVQ